ncbi:uncharacterized protein TRAVEDRAFT_75338 [Trametes versicolor FP-101664 SS1]|uniref:uncharacterized protein n=1 Tax=Trametes versicolor (strain FP-101664) TaxID=717944 RepID=UPI00046246A8|nr:uncharacterized protein TRAVEDRAFT_75338 [Trametes versicolor FP-101664 SS1]EIW52342.1 hypothetical protein TRAVEDRAFT_75338 [Trametes versicolor FP-101664 SS1]
MAMPYSEANSRLMLIDDRDSAVQYEGSWARKTRFGNSISTSSTPNASVSMEFDGTRIIVVALAAPANHTTPPTVQFAIDGALADTVTPPAAEDWTFYAIFDSQGLADGMHTINATVLEVAADYPLMLDAFMFQPSKKYWGLALAPPTLEVTGEDGTAGKGNRRANVGAIVGAVLGGLVLVALGIALFWWWRRSRQHAYTSLGGEGSYGERKSSKTVTPFVLTLPTGVVSVEDKRTYYDLSNTPSTASSSSLTPVAPALPSPEFSISVPVPSESSDTTATAASSSAAADVPQAAVLDPVVGHNTYQKVGPTDSTTLAVRKARRTSIADIMQAAIQVTRWRTSRREDLTPSDAPPRYSER